MMLRTTSRNVSQAGSTRRPFVKSVPDLVRKECVAALLVAAVLCAISVIADAPIQGPADPRGVTEANVKAPWIFVGIQQLLRYFPAVIAGVFLPLVALLIMAFIPFIPLPRSLTTASFFLVLAFVAAITAWGFFA